MTLLKRNQKDGYVHGLSEHNMNIIYYTTIASPGLPTEYHAKILNSGITVYNPQDFISILKRQWPMLEFTLQAL